MGSRLKRGLKTIAAAITFYTCIPLPDIWIGEFQQVARWAPLIGLLIGGILGLLDQGLQLLGMPLLTRSAVVVVGWVAVTGGLHLDGAMDTADGLAVMNPERRLAVMSDSATGAFGAMAAIVVLLFKVAALADLSGWRWLLLLLVPAWGRWGQQVAIALYPYLKPTGKGSFHKAALPSRWNLLPGLLLLLGFSMIPAIFLPRLWCISLGLAVGGSVIAVLAAHWFNRQLGGHTGDTYGAVVEWTEALLLVLLTTC